MDGVSTISLYERCAYNFEKLFSILFTNKPELIADINRQSAICTFDRYTERFNFPLHSSITTGMKAMLVTQEHVAEDYFD